jgi:rhamnulose-1-phosphate aldolase
MNFSKFPYVEDLKRFASNIFAKGWGEANGGNISIRLTGEEMVPFETQLSDGEAVKLLCSLPELAGEYFLVTGTGVFFRNISRFPEEGLGIVRINSQGDAFTTVYGYSAGGQPTSELTPHLLTHAARKRVSSGLDRVVIHTHATNLIALSFVLPLNTKVITRELWEMMTECLVLFPEGIGVMEWMVPGNSEIGHATARLMEEHRLVLWAHHGIFGAGQSMDQTFALIETADKAAEMLLKVMAAGGKKQAISADQLKELARAFNVNPLKGVLD